MKRILHVSDLHITSDMPDPQKNPIITNLITKLRTSFKKIHVLVFTGDLIDSLVISENIKKLSINERKQKWDEEAKKAFILGEKYLTYIKNELGISDNEIILCIGNHDVNRNCEKQEKLTCHKANAVTYEGRFDAFRTFSDNFLPFKDSYKTYFKSVENFNFLVVNSNWNNDDKARLCINCNEICQILENNKDQLSQNKNNNIFVSHSPISDFCEEARYQYSENNYSPIKDKINDYFNIHLAGDKHSQTFDMQELIVGAPINNNQITYGVYEFNNNSYCLKHVIFDGSDWKIQTDSKSIKEIYKVSKDYLKQSGLDVLYKISNVDDEIILTKKYKGSEQQWDFFNQLFLSYTTLKKTAIGTSGTKHSIDDNLISTIFDIISNSKDTVPLVVRGMPKSGKSLFLTLLYLYLLEMYAQNQLDYIPVYFNLDSVIANWDNKNWEYIENCLDNIFESSKQLSLVYNKPICFILDGLCKCKYYDTCIEDKIQLKIETSKKFARDTNRFILCLDTDEDLHLANTDINRAFDAEYVLYFNAISINKLSAKSNLEDFVEAFTNLYSNTKKEVVINNIKNLNLHSIDLHTLIIFKDYFLSNNNAQCCITELYMRYAMKVFGKQNIDNATWACYKLYYENKTYEKIINDGCKINHTLFESIKKQKSLAMFLIAKYYLTAIEKVDICKNNIHINPILNECFNFEISTFVKGLLVKNSLSEKLNIFSKKHYGKLNFKGKAMITYFTGRTTDDNKNLSKILSDQQKSLEKCTPIDNEDVFFKKVAERSIFISQISGLTEYEKYEEDYILSLLSDPKVRYVNREFYLLYYGDRKRNELTFNYQDTVYEGFDFYNVFHILASKLEEWKIKPYKSKLLRLEILTLCDLIQQRIDNDTARSRNNRTLYPEDVCSFFYDCRLVDKAKSVLDFVVSIINFYLSFDLSKNLFTDYLYVKKCEFLEFSLEISDRKSPHKMSSIKLIEECSNISFTQKIGWKIPDLIDRLDDELYAEYSGNKNYETVANHMYECYLIGLFYLPKDNDNDPMYDKKKVLDLLLIHDLGESVINDYPPFYVNIQEKKKQENDINKKIFLSGLHDGIADLTPQLTLWNNWCEKTDINAKIARDIDKIQMIYKMFVLLSKTDIRLSPKRIESILKEKEMIKTVYGKNIYKALITYNKNIDPMYK